MPIEGKPTLFHIIDTLVSAFGFVDIKLGVAYKSEQVKEYVDSYITPSIVTVTYVPHKPGSESYGAYQTMKEYMKDQFLVMPGDILAKEQVYEQLITIFAHTKSDVVMAFSPKIEKVDTHGVAKISHDNITSYHFPPPHTLEHDHVRDMCIYATDTNFFDLKDA